MKLILRVVLVGVVVVMLTAGGEMLGRAVGLAFSSWVLWRAWPGMRADVRGLWSRTARVRVPRGRFAARRPVRGGDL